MRDAERGLTLTEVMIVMALAVVVMLGLVGFYMNSQATWIDGSSQAITQRDGTLLIQTMTEAVRSAARAVVSNYPDAAHQALFLYASKSATDPFRCFYWKDSRVYSGDSQPRDGDPAVVTSPVGRFQLETVDTTLVLMDLVELPTAKGAPVRLSSAAALYNR